MMEHNRILFVVYTPFFGYLPKRMAEIESRAKLDKVHQVIITPQTYQETLTGLRADTVHLIKLHPDTSMDDELSFEYFKHLDQIQYLVEAIKIHNNI